MENIRIVLDAVKQGHMEYFIPRQRYDMDLLLSLVQDGYVSVSEEDVDLCEEAKLTHKGEVYLHELNDNRPTWKKTMLVWLKGAAAFSHWAVSLTALGISIWVSMKP